MRKCLLPIFALALILLGGSISSAASPTTAGSGTWRSGGPKGGPAMAVAASPEYASDGLVLAGGGQWLSGYGDRTGKGLFRSTDGGQHWSPDGTGMDSQYSGSIEDIAFSSHWSSDGTAFVGTWGGIYRTTDWAETWQRVADDVLYNPGAATTVALSPGYYLDGVVLAAGGFGGLYMSEDGGDTWDLTLGGVVTAAAASGIGAFSAVAYSPDFIVDTTAFASDWAGVWRTENRGGQWERVLDTPTWSVRDVEVSCNFPSDGTVFAATATQASDPPYLLRSTDGGDTWDPAESGLDRTISALTASCQGTTTTLYAASDAVFRSADQGDSWHQLTNWPEGIWIKDLFVSAPTGPSASTASSPHLFAATYQGVYHSSDGGDSWQVSQGFTLLKTSVVAPSPAYTTDGVLYAGTEAGVYRSGDRGLTWQPASKGLVGDFMSEIGDIVLSPEYASDHTLFAASSLTGRLGGTVHRSTDEGMNWEALWTSEHVYDLAISPGFGSDRTLFAVAGGSEVYRSTDGGSAFSPVLSESGFNAFEIGISPQFVSDGTVYVSGFGPLYQSTDGGDSWAPLPEGWPPHYGIALSPQYGVDDTLFLSYREIEGSGLRPESGIIRSSDAGASWDLASAGLPGSYEPWPQSIALSPGFTSNARLYTAMSGNAHLGPNQAYGSASAGHSWAAIPPIDDEPPIHALSVSTEPGGLDVLHAATGSGAWHYTSACIDGVANGGFEFDGAWVRPDTPVQSAYSIDEAHAGFRSLRTGILPSQPNLVSWSSAYQTLTLPQDVATASLRFWTYPLSGEPRVVAQSPSSNPMVSPMFEDTQYALVLDTQGELLETLLWQASDSRLWTLHEYDLSHYAGESVRIHIGSYNNGTGGKTAMYVDDVVLELCPDLPSTPSPTPTVTPTATPSATTTDTPTMTPTSTATSLLDRLLYLPLVFITEQAPTHTPTATVTPTATATRTPPPTCVQAVANGGFEADGSWIMPITPVQAGYSTTYSLSGLRSMRLGIEAGGWNVHSYSSSKQFVDLPPVPGTAILSFWYYPVSGEAYSGSSGADLAGYSILAGRFDELQLPESIELKSDSAIEGNDRQYALLQDAYGNWYLLLWTLSNDRAWHRVDIDLSAFMGQTVLIHFETYNDGWWGTTAMYVDNVSIEVCGPDVPVPTPTPTATTSAGPPEDALIIDDEWVHGLVGHRSSQTLYAYSADGLYRSFSSGASWSRVGDSVGEFVMSPANTSVLFDAPGYPCLAGGPDVPMRRSTDGGASWFELPEGKNLKVLAAHLTDANLVYAAGCDGPYISTDAGASWTHQPSPLWGLLEVKHIAPVEPDWQIVYAAGVSEGGGGAILKSTDGGANWQQVSPTGPDPDIWWITDLLVDPDQPDTVRFLEPHSPWWTGDAGSNWEWDWTGLHDVVYDPGGPADQTYGLYDLEMDAADHDLLYLGTIRGLYINSYGSGGWYQLTNGYAWRNAPLGKLLLLESAPDRLFLVRREPDQGVHVFDLADIPTLATPTPTATPVLPSIITTIPLGPDSHPHGVAVDPDGDRVFVGLHGSNHDGHELAVIETNSFTVADTIDLGSGAEGPNGVAYHAASDRVYVANRNSHNVAVVDPTAGLVDTILPVGNMPNGVGVVGDWVYVANFGVGTVTAIDATTATVQHDIAGVGAGASHFAVNSAEQIAYLSATVDNRVVTLHDGLHTDSVPDVSLAYGVGYDPNSGRLFVGNRSFHHTITIIDVDTNSVVDTMDIGREPFMLVVNPGTNHLFVTTTDELEVYRTTDLSLVTTLALPAGSEEGIALNPLRDLVYVSSRDSDSLTVIQDVP